MKKHYQTLGLKEGASQEEIQEAYERLSDTLDPKKMII
jgi:DnaJ-class molecular chaperone